MEVICTGCYLAGFLALFVGVFIGACLGSWIYKGDAEEMRTEVRRSLEAARLAKTREARMARELAELQDRKDYYEREE